MMQHMDEARKLRQELNNATVSAAFSWSEQYISRYFIRNIKDWITNVCLCTDMFCDNINYCLIITVMTRVIIGFRRDIIGVFKGGMTVE